MVSPRRLLVLLVVFGGAGSAAYAGFQVWRQAQLRIDGSEAPAEWPPFPAPTSVPNIVDERLPSSGT